MTNDRTAELHLDALNEDSATFVSWERDNDMRYTIPRREWEDGARAVIIRYTITTEKIQ